MFCNRASFEGGADFHRTKFEGTVDFGNSRFMQSANFSLADFAATARFVFCHFEAIEFFETVFHDYTDFTGAEFGGRTGFTFVQFYADVSFQQAKFKEIAIFRGKPGDSNFFNEANFESVLLPRLNILRFVDVDCARTRFLGADVILMTFDGVRWCAVSKTRCGIYDELLQKRNKEFFSITDVEQLYRSLKHNYEGRRDLARAGDFHIGEKEMRLKNPRTPPSLRALLWLSKTFSGYGESYLRPFFWFVGLLVVGSFLLMTSGLTYRVTKHQLSVSSLLDWSQVAGFVFARALHLDKDVSWFDPAIIPNTVGLWAGVLGPVFGALLVLGIRNRLKR